MVDQYIRELGAVVDLGIEEEVDTSADQPSTISGATEVWLKIGQSNSVGTDGTGPILWTTEDTRHPRVWEHSRGIHRPGAHPAPAGQIHQHPATGQDDGNGIGFGQQFGKRRADLNPRSKIIIVNRGVGGTGFNGNRWNPGDDLYTAAVTDANLAMANNPGAVFGGFLWHQGESDAGTGQATYEAALAAMVAGMRTEITGATDALFLAGTMVESWIAAGEATRREIDLAHRRIAEYIPNSDFVDFSDLTDLQDTIHFGTGSLRIMGRRYAEKAQEYAPPAQWLSHHFKVVDGEIVDLTGNGGAVYGDVPIVNDPTRGDVMDIAQGYATSVLMNPEEYTKALWVNRKSDPGTYENFLSGDRITNAVQTSHFFGGDGYGQGATNASLNEAPNLGMPLGTWHFLALTRNADGFQMYLDGLPFVPSNLGNGTIVSPQGLLIGSFANPGPVANRADAFMDDIHILPYVASFAELEEMRLG